MGWATRGWANEIILFTLVGPLGELVLERRGAAGAASWGLVSGSFAPGDTAARALARAARLGLEAELPAMSRLGGFLLSGAERCTLAHVYVGAMGPELATRIASAAADSLRVFERSAVSDLALADQERGLYARLWARMRGDGAARAAVAG